MSQLKHSLLILYHNNPLELKHQFQVYKNIIFALRNYSLFQEKNSNLDRDKYIRQSQFVGQTLTDTYWEIPITDNYSVGSWGEYLGPREMIIRSGEGSTMINLIVYTVYPI